MLPKTEKAHIPASSTTRAQVPVQVCLPPALTKQLDNQAQREGVRSRSLMLRRAAYAYLAEKARERGEDPTKMLTEGIR